LIGNLSTLPTNDSNHVRMGLRASHFGSYDVMLFFVTFGTQQQTGQPSRSQIISP